MDRRTARMWTKPVARSNFRLVLLGIVMISTQLAVGAFAPRSIGCEGRQTKICAANEPQTAISSMSLLETYEYDGWRLSFRFKEASPGFETNSSVLLIHPVGIGLSSWFWEKFIAEWSGPALLAPDLIGCGIKNGGDAWDPDVRGLSFPLGWVQGCEALLQSQPPQKCSTGSYIVMSQGGLAPVGVMLAARNPDTISHLILASPPSWKDMTTPIPENELTRNYNFLRSPVFGPPAFQLLESRWAIEFFSNTFLFDEKCDELWLDRACREIAFESRPPVTAFNAGLCNHRSFEQDLQSVPQPTLVLSGSGDRRAPQRDMYQRQMQRCTLQTVHGQNILPWESPREVCDVVKQFCFQDAR